MRFRPRFSLAFLLVLCTVAACLIASVVWLRSNTIIRSGVSGTLVARNGERFPINRWFHLAIFDPSVFYDEGINFSTPAKDMKKFSELETNDGRFPVKIILWKYEGSAADDFRVELLVQLVE